MTFESNGQTWQVVEDCRDGVIGVELNSAGWVTAPLSLTRPQHYRKCEIGL